MSKTSNNNDEDDNLEIRTAEVTRISKESTMPTTIEEPKCTTKRSRVFPVSDLTELEKNKDPGSTGTISVLVKAGDPKNSSLTTVNSVFDQLDPRRNGKDTALWKIKINNVLESVPFTLVSIVFTMMILYLDLIRQAALPSSADPYFTAWAIFAIIALFTEVVLSSLCRPGYFPKFYFWMDLIASFSLLCDIPKFTEFITFYTDDDSNRHVTLERAAKGIQAAARAARIMQVLAAAQLLRIRAKRRLLNFKNSFGGTDDGLSRLSSTVDDDTISLSKSVGNLKPQSRIGEKVTERTMRKVTIGVLIIILVLPVFDSWVFYGRPTPLESGGLVMLHDIYGAEGNSSGFQEAQKTFLNENVFRAGTRNTAFIYRLEIWNTTVLDTNPKLRDIEWQSSITPGCHEGDWPNCYVSKVWANVKWEVQMQALLDIGRVTFILLILSGGAVLFIRDTDELVLRPIERMVGKVRHISRNPLAMVHSKDRGETKVKSQKQLETRLLENSIVKICNLLSVGFGEAGAEVIADNIRSGGDLNPMVPGRRVRAIFGFCDIRSFTDTTEVLQEEVMEYVNSIASIVHTEVSHHGGAANKNIGDAFLLVWKLPQTSCEADDRIKRSSILGARMAAGQELISESGTVTHLADAALASFIVIQAALKRSKKLQNYCKRRDLNARMPGFEVSLGFGLHFGWAIEGAIGSRHKIDASYLSPHVNTASRLEAATKQFGVPILLSEAFVKLLSPSVRQKCREIDCVMLKGSLNPIRLYTFDVDTRDSVSKHIDEIEIRRITNELNLQETMEEPEYVSYSDYPYFDEFEEHPDIVSCQRIEQDFLDTFNEGFMAYKDGRWSEAIQILEEASQMRRADDGGVLGDGPSMTLIRYMKSFGGKSPASWSGYRELTEK